MSLTIDVLVQKISDDVIARMISDNDTRAKATDGTPTPLAGGKILLGPEFIAQNDAPPRMVVIPLGGPVSPKWAIDGRPGSPPRPASALDDIRVTYQTTGEIHVWGVDFGDAETLFKRFVFTLSLLVPGNFAVTKASFNYANAYVQSLGRELVATFGVDVPVSGAKAIRAPLGTTAALSSSTTTPGNNVPETQNAP